MFQNSLNITGDSLATMDANLVRKLWTRIASIFSDDEDAFAAMEGGPESIIETVTDVSKGKGQTITFPYDEEFYNEPRLGEERFTSANHYDNLRVFDNQLTVDFARWGSNYSARTEEAMGMRDEIIDRIPEKQGSQEGRWKSEYTALQILHKTNAENHVIAGGKTSVHSLTTSDDLSYDEIVALGAMLEPMGGEPAMVGVDANGNKIYGRVLVTSVPGKQSLKQDSNYIQALRYSAERGTGNRFFAGGLEHIDGHVIKVHNPIDRLEAGAIGSPLQPKARLGVAITSGTSSISIYGGGNSTRAALTEKLYFKHFPKYAYRFLLSDILATSANFWELGAGGTNHPSTGNFFVVIVNSRAATTQPGKWGMFEISANDGNKLTTNKRLGAAAAGVAPDRTETTLGGVTYSAGVNATAHDEGSLIYLANGLGAPLMASPMLSRRCLRRGYGKYKRYRAVQEDEGGFGKYTYLWTVMGMGVKKDSTSRVPGIVILKHSGTIPGWAHPTGA